LAAIGDDPALSIPLLAAQILDPFRHFNPCLFGPSHHIGRKRLSLDAKIIEGRLMIEPFLSLSGRVEEKWLALRTIRLNDGAEGEKPRFVAHDRSLPQSLERWKSRRQVKVPVFAPRRLGGPTAILTRLVSVGLILVRIERWDHSDFQGSLDWKRLQRFFVEAHCEASAA
jgi:hypothetical protein